MSVMPTHPGNPPASDDRLQRLVSETERLRNEEGANARIERREADSRLIAAEVVLIPEDFASSGKKTLTVILRRQTVRRALHAVTTA